MIQRLVMPQRCILWQDFPAFLMTRKALKLPGYPIRQSLLALNIAVVPVRVFALEQTTDYF
jgi:hypothetical protein